MPVASNVGRVTINSSVTPVQIVAARVGRISLRLFVEGTPGSFLQIGPTSGLTVANGYPLARGENILPNTEGTVFGIGIGFTVSFLETF